MDRFQAMQVFVRVVEANSFTRAADGLALPRTTVTTIIQNLERHLGVRLLNRTTRRISLTPDGAAYYKHSTRILAEVEETEACLQDSASRPQGRLRIDVPPAIGNQILLPALCEFHSKYPDVELVIGLSDRRVDLVQEAVDCVIRGGPLEDSSLVARRIGILQSVTCASPDYLERHGMPHALEDLQRHQAVHYFWASGRNCNWDFVIDGKEQQVDVPGSVSVNDWMAHLTCGLKGFGMIQTARFMALPHMLKGDLVEVLPQWRPSPTPISLLYLQSRQLSPKVRAFSDWVAGLFAACPLLSGGDENDVGALTCDRRLESPQLTPEAVQAARRNAPVDAPEFVM
ncbi:LysR family transcriptional regulator [Bordetella genomosp. 13]|uniref:LysR family transcriptional regulator n=1 Tax=Bordetella genomosp. 13 TaxID=463040 RepID=A0A1W6ZHI3_9BORD|nr:LysR family transcriptional regulator [Bordetella genomosp. 13]ARP96757.1 LysR family transcriptional regulator [Bordetella genomosp. 13]